MSGSNIINLGGSYATKVELGEIRQKLREMKVNVGVSLSDRELKILGAMVEDKIMGSTRTFDKEASYDEIIEEMMLSGCCYLRLLSLLPSLHLMTPHQVKCQVEWMVEKFGQNPGGMEVVTQLVLIEFAMSTGIDPDRTFDSMEFSVLNPTGKAKYLDDIMKSDTKLRFKEDGGLFHIEPGVMRCKCTDVMCEHGWSARFILQAIAREGCKVGAEIDFSALFVPKVESDQNEGEGPMSKRAMAADLESELVTALSTQLESRTEMLDQVLTRLLKEREGVRDGARDYDKEESEVSTIAPGDSSSVVERYKRKYMPKAYTFGRTGTTLSHVSEDCGEMPVKEVVSGFVKTTEIREKEVESYDRVYTINGLAAPFKNPRLNFLMHFHTALEECSFDPEIDPFEAMVEIGSAKPRNPTGELMKQVVERTFDFRELVISSNPFRIPFIEVGMPITDSIILKSLELLLLEYKTHWFQELKCLKVPQFHLDFNGASTRLRTHSAKHHARGRVRSNGQFDKVSSMAEEHIKKYSGRRAQTILGFKV